MKVGFTGTRHGMTESQSTRLKLWLLTRKVDEFHHGDCIGSDAQAHAIAQALHIPVHIHPPKEVRLRAFCRMGPRDFMYPTKPYRDRNHDIVDMTAILVATPAEMEEQIRSGTWATVRYGWKEHGKDKVILMLPNGERVVMHPEKGDAP